MADCPGVALVPIGRVDPVIISWVTEDLPKVLPTSVVESPPLPLSPRHFHAGRAQYLGDGLLLGITGEDLFSPGMNFVFGIATTGRALVSTFRLRPEVYGMPPAGKLYRWRVLTEAVHELGHALGLPHCEHPGCVMYFSTWIGDTDRKGPGFCYRCRRRIGWSGEGDGQYRPTG